VLQNTYSTGALNRHRSIHYLTTTGLLHSLVGTLCHTIQLQCHQIELHAIVETWEFKRDTKGQTYKCWLTTNKKNRIWDVLCLTFNRIKVTAWRTSARDCLYLRHTQYRCRSISRLGYDPSVNRTAEGYFTTKVNKNSKSSQRQNWMAVSNTMVQTNVDTNKHEVFNLMLTNHRKEDGINPPRTKNTL
jgi:hypothetical protein